MKRNKKSAKGTKTKRRGTPPPRRRMPRIKSKHGGEVRGVFCGTRRGFGFVRREGVLPDVFVPAAATMGALDGDTVLVRLSARGERPEGKVTRVVSRGCESIVGTVVRQGGELYLEPDLPRMPPLPLPPRGRARPGEKVEVLREGDGIRFLRSFGAADSRTANYEAILATYAVPTEFAPEALREAERLAALPQTEEGRRRIRGVVLTIDSEGAKDLDDAISLRRTQEGFILSVHIADVSHYVRRGTALDGDAHERGTSVYFADRVVPMLPAALSNGACSLNEGEDKYTLTAEIALDATGEIKKTKLYKSIINSRKRGVYREVNDLFAKGKESPFYGAYRTVYGTLTEMRELYLILAERNRRRGTLELETAEARILLDSDGEPIEVTKEERGDAERLIEAFMLMANRAVAELLTERGIPCVYRIHEPPPTDKYAALVEYLASQALPPPFRRGEEPSAAALSRLIEKAGERGLATPVSLSVLRAMAKARYSHTPSPHFGLSLSLYCHFTSPIRRLSDLVTHRIIGAVLLGGEPPERYRAAARRAALAATEGELRALGAERAIEALYKTLYLARHLGECFDGTVSSVTAHGYYVELDNTCEGLVPTSLLGEGAVYDEKARTLRVGDLTVSVGDRVLVRVRDADVATSRVTFEPCERGD